MEARLHGDDGRLDYVGFTSGDVRFTGKAPNDSKPVECGQ